MKTVVIKNLDYDSYGVYTDALDANIPFAVTHDYNKRLQIGIFRFEDSSYIPEYMKRYMMGITGNDLRVTKVNDELVKNLIIDKIK